MSDPEPEQPADVDPPPPLFDHPLSVEAIQFPFRDESTGSRAADFYDLLKTHVLGRFLAGRRATAPPG